MEINLNKVEKLYDGQKIYITKAEKNERLQVKSGGCVFGTSNLIGKFKSVKEIKLVLGNWDKMFEKIKKI